MGIDSGDAGTQEISRKRRKWLQTRRWYVNLCKKKMVLCAGINSQVSPYLTDDQHGSGCSRVTLINYAAPILVADVGAQVDVAYFDFSKAFDMVENEVLLTKLAVVDFTAQLLRVFAGYWANSRQYVDYANQISEPYTTLTT